MSFEMTASQKAMRLFAVLVAGCTRYSRPGPDGETAIFRGEVRLNALMFWLRNPDYLAEELLDLTERTGDQTHLATVFQMLADEEPVLRRDAMLKWRFGAYEPIDDEMGILSSLGLIRTTMIPQGAASAENDFLLYPEAFDVEATLGGNIAYAWYADRMKLVLMVAADRPGYLLKNRQYKQLDYAQTRSGSAIPAITERVTKRLHVLLQGA